MSNTDSSTQSNNTDYRIKRLVRAVQNHQFHPHHYVDKSLTDQYHAWFLINGNTRSFRPFMMLYWPYRYWLVVSDQVDLFQITEPCVFQIRDTDHTGIPMVPGHRVVGCRRQQDRNRTAKHNWSQVIGWAGGQFVY